MSEIDELVALIGAQLGEREAALRKIAAAKKTEALSGLEMGLRVEMATYTSAWPGSLPPYEIEAWRLMIADVESKRRIVDTVTRWGHPRLYDGSDENVGPYPCSRDGAECDCGLYERQVAVLQALALPYAGHQEAWKP